MPIDNQALKSAVEAAKSCVHQNISERETKIADLVLRVAEKQVYAWSERPLVATYQKLFITQAAICNVYMDCLIADEYRLIVSPVSVQLQRFTSSKQGLSERTTPGPSLDSRPNLSFFSDEQNFLGVSEHYVQSLIDKFWRKYDEYIGTDSALAVLGLESNASWKDVQARYRRLASIHHPDKGGDKLRFVQIKEAYEELRWKKP